MYYKVHVLKNVPSGYIQSLTSSHYRHCYQTGPLVQFPTNWFFCFSFCFLFPSLFPPCREILLESGSDFVSPLLKSLQNSFPFPFRGYHIPLTSLPTRLSLLRLATPASVLFEGLIPSHQEPLLC